MARVPEIIRRNPISQVAPQAPKAGQGWNALAQLGQMAADFVKPAAKDEARAAGEKSVYRDEQGNLKVDERSLFSGEMGAIQNQAAFAKYLGQKQIELTQTMSELGVKYEFDPGGFKEASDAYVKTLRDDEDLPSVLKDDIVRSVEEEGQRRFNGLHRAEISRTYREADKQTATARDMMLDDYVSLYVEGDDEAAAAKWAEIEGLSKVRADAPYISETPAETEAMMRGARGTAKAARLIRDLNDLDGATEISDERRAEITGVLKDPDLSPKTRQSLYAATQGRLKSIDASGMVKSMTNDAYSAMVVRAESGGKNNAKAATSSAYGRHQFLKGTWAGLVKRYKPAWAKGLSPGQVQAMRGDPAASTEMFNHFRRENQQVLSRAGMPINPATEYMAHFFGAGSAVKVLAAAPDTPLSAIVPKATISANKFLKGMTARDAQNWAGRKMTMKASDMARMQVQVNDIEDPELRRYATQNLNHEIKVRRSIETAAADVFEERLMSGDQSLTAQEIRENHDLSTDDQMRLTSALDKATAKTDEMAQIVTRMNDPGATWSRTDNSDKKDVNKAYEAGLDDAPAASEQGVKLAAEVTKSTGIIPKKAADALKSGIASDDPAVAGTALETLRQLKDIEGGNLSSVAGAKSLNSALSDFEFYGQFMDAEQAAQRMIDNREKKPKNITDEAKKAAEKLDISDITDRFDKSFFSDPKVGDKRAGRNSENLLTGLQKNEMMAEYTRLFKDAYGETADFDLSQNRALDEMDRIYGVNDVSGPGRVMKFPPQKVYPPVNGSHEWMGEQLVDEVNTFMFGDEASAPWQSFTEVMADGMSMGADRKWLRRKDIALVSDAQTAAEAKSGKPASYVVYAMRDGVLDRIPQRFTFDPAPAKQAAREVFESQRGDAMNDDPDRRYFRNVERFGKDQADQMLNEDRGITQR